MQSKNQVILKKFIVRKKLPPLYFITIYSLLDFFLDISSQKIKFIFGIDQDGKRFVNLYC